MQALRIIFVLLTALLCFSFSHSQTRTIEHLKKNIKAAKTNAEKLQAIFNLCEQGYTLHPDTLIAYAGQAEKIAAGLNQPHNEIKSRYYLASALTTKGLIDSSLQVADECLRNLKNKINDAVLQANLHNQKGRCYMRKNQYKEAVAMGFQVIGDAEKAQDTLLQVKGKTLIGWAYLEMGQLQESLKWHLNALYTAADTVLLDKYAILFANLAINYNDLGKTDSAFYFINKAVSSARKYENLFALSNSLAIQAQLFVRSNQPQLAEAPLKEVVSIRKLIGDPFYIVSDMSQLALYYAHYGQAAKGIALCKEGIAIANKYKISTKLFFLYNTLAENYKAAGNTKQYAEVLEKIITLKDSVFQLNSAEALAEMQARYEAQKKENIIISQQLDLVKQNYRFYGLLILLFIAVVIAAFAFRSYRKKQKQKLDLMVEEEKLIAAEAITEAEERERKRIAADLHDNLGAYAASIVSNLDNISLHQTGNGNAIALQELRNNSQAIVSQLNDTIWALKKDALSLTAISDRLKIFIQRIQSSYPHIQIDVVENITVDQLLSPSQAFHLFQVTQEGINNALRHSGCRQVTVIIDGGDHWSITIKDDGKGLMPVVNGSKGGQGIVNMRTRSAEAGWVIDWKQNEPAGTTVVIKSTTN